jgi:uncharacterized protein (TIGR02001 family)
MRADSGECFARGIQNSISREQQAHLRGRRMKKLRLLLSSTVLISAMMVGAASAEGQISGAITLTTDYLFRGVTQTSNNPAIQGSLDYTNSGFYVGVWGSNVDFGNDETIETDVYAGYRPTLGPVALDFGVIGYFYPGSSDTPAELDYWEGKIAASITPMESLMLGAGLFYSPEFTGETGEAIYAEINAAYALSEAWSVSGAFGSQDIDLATDYDTWNLGVSLLAHGLKFDLRYTDTDLTGLDEVVTFSIGRSL